MEGLIYIGLFIGSNLATAFFVSKYINRKWRLQAKEHALKVIKKARQIEKENKELTPDEVWDKLADGGWMR